MNANLNAVLNEYRSMVGELANKCATYAGVIDSLKSENEALQAKLKASQGDSTKDQAAA